MGGSSTEFRVHDAPSAKRSKRQAAPDSENLLFTDIHLDVGRSGRTVIIISQFQVNVVPGTKISENFLLLLPGLLLNLPSYCTVL